MFAKNNSFVSVANFDFNVITSNEITISNRNVENKIHNKQTSFLKKNSNDVESSHTDDFSSSLSFGNSKSNDQKNLDPFDDFSIIFFK